MALLDLRNPFPIFSYHPLKHLWRKFEFIQGSCKYFDKWWNFHLYLNYFESVYFTDFGSHSSDVKLTAPVWSNLSRISLNTLHITDSYLTTPKIRYLNFHFAKLTWVYASTQYIFHSCSSCITLCRSSSLFDFYLFFLQFQSMI